MDDLGILKREVIESFNDNSTNINVIINKFNEELYKIYGVDGGVAIVADYSEMDIKFLRSNKEKPYPSLELKITSKSLAPEILDDVKGMDIHKFITNLYKLQRKLIDVSDSKTQNIVFNRAPDYLNESNFNNVQYHFIDKEEMFDLFVLWRLCLWLMSHTYTIDSKIKSDKVSSIIRKKFNKCNGEFYCDNLINTNAGIKSERHLESDISVLDSPSDSGFSKFEQGKWQELRHLIDKPVNLFQDEIAKLNHFLGTSIDLKYVEELFIKYDIFKNSPTITIQNILDFCHKRNTVLISYFYFSIFSRRIKSHLILPIHSSKSHPIFYRTSEDFEKVSSSNSVLTYVCALDSDIEPEQVIALKGILKLASENILKVFYRNVIKHEINKDTFQSTRNVILSSLPHVEGWNANVAKKVFQIGHLENNLTFLSQQSRAINLVKSLVKLKYIKSKGSGNKVAIIGGGLSGITTFYALKKKGITHVHLYERNDELLSNFKNVEHRYIHPNIYHWPDRLFDEKLSELPFLNWESGNCGDVVSKILSQFFSSENVSHNDIFYNKKITGIKNTGRTYKLLENDGQDEIEGNYNLIIICSGFSSENRKIKQIISQNFDKKYLSGKSSDRNKAIKKRYQSYWEKDSISKFYAKKKNIAIIGSGDGALIDIIRASLRKKDKIKEPLSHYEIMLLSNKKALFEFGVMLSQFDKEFRTINSSRNVLDLFKYYKTNIHKSTVNLHLYSECKKLIKQYFRKDLVINFINRDGYFNLNSSLLNRAIAYIIFESHELIVKNINHDFLYYWNNKVFVYDKANKKVETITPIYQCYSRTGVSKTQFEFENKTVKISYVQSEKKLSKDYLEFERQISRLNITNHVTIDSIDWYLKE